MNFFKADNDNYNSNVKLKDFEFLNKLTEDKCEIDSPNRNLIKNIAIPIFIVQHMPEGFTASFAKRLNDSAQVPVKEASHLEKIQAGTVYVAPGNYHMHIHQDELFLTQTEKRNGVRPAVDHLFESAAPLYKNRLLSVILTGMGKDGTQGMKAVKEAGGYTLAQNKESCAGKCC